MTEHVRQTRPTGEMMPYSIFGGAVHEPFSASLRVTDAKGIETFQAEMNLTFDLIVDQIFGNFLEIGKYFLINSYKYSVGSTLQDLDFFGKWPVR